MTRFDDTARNASNHFHMAEKEYTDTVEPFLRRNGYKWDGGGGVAGWATIVYVRDSEGTYLSHRQVARLLRSAVMRRAIQDGSWSAENYSPNMLRTARPFGEFPRVRPPLPGYVFLVTRGWMQLSRLGLYKSRGAAMKEWRDEDGRDAFEYLEEKRYREAARYVDDEVHLADPDRYDEDEEEW